MPVSVSSSDNDFRVTTETVTTASATIKGDLTNLGARELARRSRGAEAARFSTPWTVPRMYH